MRIDERSRGNTVLHRATVENVGEASARDLVVAVRRYDGVDILEVSAATGGLLGHFDPRTGRLDAVDAQDSVAVAAAVAPYLLGEDQPFGELSQRHLAAADILWTVLDAGPFTWQRSVPLHGWLLLFYCPLVRLALEIVDDGELADCVDASMLTSLGVTLALVPLRDLEQQPASVASWLSGVCTTRADSRPGTQPATSRLRSVGSRTVRALRARQP